MKEYKPIILSLIRFFSVYLILTVLYYLYLNYYQNKLSTCDPFTYIVAKQSSYFLNWFNINSETHHYNQDNYMWFFIDRKPTSIVNEGCNALSVIILYLSFIIAFAATLKKTFFYLLITIPLIHLCNIVRVGFINYVFHYYPEYSKNFHDYIFPIIIYGVVITLWMTWIRYFIFLKK